MLVICGVCHGALRYSLVHFCHSRTLAEASVAEAARKEQVKFNVVEDKTVSAGRVCMRHYINSLHDSLSHELRM